jgi:hypothetical protein
MTSPPPLLYDTHYHMYNRGVNGENIFVEERNYELFLRLSGHGPVRLLPVEEPLPSLVAGDGGGRDRKDP